MCTYCGVDGHTRDECGERQEKEIGTDRQLDDPLETCDECGTANNLSVNSSCWKCGADLTHDRKIRCDGGTVQTDPRRWTPRPTESSAPRCQACDNRVTTHFARVFGDGTDTVWHCPDCVAYRDLKQGAGARPDFDPETDRGRTSEKYPMFGSTDQ